MRSSTEPNYRLSEDVSLRTHLIKEVITSVSGWHAQFTNNEDYSYRWLRADEGQFQVRNICPV